MKANGLVLLNILLLLSACTLFGRDNNPRIYVKSYGYPLNQGSKIQFYQVKVDDEPFENFSYRRKVVAQCEQEAADQGYNVEPQSSKCEDCYMVFVSVGITSKTETKYARSYVSPSNTTCSNVFGSISCTTYGGQTYGGYYYNESYWQKVAVFNATSFNKEKKKLEPSRKG